MSMKIVVDHKLGKETAKNRIKNLLADLKVEHGDKIQQVEEQWNDSGANYSFRIMGMSVKGTIDVEASIVQITGNLPLAAYPFKNMIEHTIRNKTLELLS